MKRLSFLADVFPRPRINRVTDAFTTLNHYCQVNYSIPSDRLRTLIHPRFDPFPIISHDQAIISAVVFQEKNFHFPSLPFLGRYTFSQTNYRTYICNRQGDGPTDSLVLRNYFRSLQHIYSAIIVAFSLAQSLHPIRHKFPQCQV